MDQQATTSSQDHHCWRRLGADRVPTCMNAMVLLLSCASSSTRRSIDMSSCESVIRPPSVASLETCRHVASAALLVLNSRSMSRPTATLSVSNISSTTASSATGQNVDSATRHCTLAYTGMQYSARAQGRCIRKVRS
eukprot:365747-Chlamydomonas_euryale.AAC.29